MADGVGGLADWVMSYIEGDQGDVRQCGRPG